MSTRPILFSGPMVRALLDGRKTQTRRVLPRGDWSQALPEDYPFQPGDRLWVREAMTTIAGTGLAYAADGQPVDMSRAPDDFPDAVRRTMPGMFMPRWASRLMLAVTDVRVQRVQEISEADAQAEGCKERFEPEHPETPTWSARQSFADLWNSLNAKRGAGWDANPWVVALTFTVERRNVDV